MSPKRKRDTASSPLVDPLTSPPAKLPKKPSVLDRVLYALRILKLPSSAQAIIKTCAAHCDYADAAKIRKAIKSGLASHALQTAPESAAKFWIAGEPIPQTAAGPAVAIEDTKEGKGAAVEKGDEVFIDYELFLKETGGKVEGAKRFGFVQGGGEVIKGMDAGVLGLKVGGKRTVNVPWQLGYGNRGSGPDVPPCSDLTFKITLVDIKK